MTKPLLLSLSAAALALAGCSRSEPEPEPTNATVVQDLPEETNMAEPALPEPTPTPEQNLAEALPAEAAPEPDAQMLDDASATGMTSRSARGVEEEAPANAR